MVWKHIRQYGSRPVLVALAIRSRSISAAQLRGIYRSLKVRGKLHSLRGRLIHTARNPYQRLCIQGNDFAYSNISLYLTQRRTIMQAPHFVRRKLSGFDNLGANSTCGPNITEGHD
jgi:hypothetical protein